MLIERSRIIARIQSAFRVHPAVALTGPRQCGKTTLARMFAGHEPVSAHFDLERPVDRRKLMSPEQALSERAGVVVIDEIQRQPELFETLRVLVDRPDSRARFLLLGSASPTLVRGVAETLAGRVGLVDLSGFDLSEIQDRDWRTLWSRGGFPPSYLAPDAAASSLWRENFIRTFLERDIPQLGITIPAESLRRFWIMVAHYHGQVWNAAEFARSIGSNQATARRYLDILGGACVVRALTPWRENLKKRQVKSPKIYVRDSGLLHALLDVDSFDALSGHPKCGASFEGFAIEQLLAGLDTRSASFWATHAGAELDLMVTISGRRYGFECKYGDAPATTRSMRVAVEDLQLTHLWVVYPGEDAFELDTGITALPVRRIPDLVRQLAG